NHHIGIEFTNGDVNREIIINTSVKKIFSIYPDRMVKERNGLCCTQCVAEQAFANDHFTLRKDIGCYNPKWYEQAVEVIIRDGRCLNSLFCQRKVQRNITRSS